jgi:hypothetical protein
LRIVKSGVGGATSGNSYFDSNGNLIFLGTTLPASTLRYIGGGPGANNVTINALTGASIVLSIGGTGATAFVRGGLSKLNNIATAGLVGMAVVYGSYSTLANVAAVTNAINYTPPAVAGRYRISWVVNVQSNTTDSFSVTATWKDAGGTARTQAIGGFAPSGTSLTTGLITNVIGVGVYYGTALINIDNSATAITVSTVGTFTTVSYDFSAILEQVA